jgi:hypothetical protein
VSAGAGRYKIALDAGAISFHPADRPDSVLAGIELQVASQAAVLHSAKALGCIDTGGSIRVSGIRVRLSEAA